MSAAITKQERAAMVVVLRMLRRHQIELAKDALERLEDNEHPQAFASFALDNTGLNNAQVLLMQLVQYAPLLPDETPPAPPANVVHLKPPR